jgi:hypothetical protein
MSKPTTELIPPPITNYDTSFRLLDFNIFDEKRVNNDDSEDDGGDDDDNSAAASAAKKYKKDEKFTTIQMFGINENGETCAIFVRDYQPFFYVKVGDEWSIPQKSAFISHLKEKVGKFYQDSIMLIIKKMIVFCIEISQDMYF